MGYSDQELTHNRYRVTFTGNSETPRETVEDYLLRRAAEVTLKAGYDAFLFDTRNTKAKTTYMSTFTGWPGWGGYGWYWHSWAYGPYGPGPLDMDSTSRPITRYHAYAEIVSADGRSGKERAARDQCPRDHQPSRGAASRARGAYTGQEHLDGARSS